MTRNMMTVGLTVLLSFQFVSCFSIERLDASKHDKEQLDASTDDMSARTKRAIFDIIPSQEDVGPGQGAGGPGTSCVCEDKDGVDCVLDFRRRCRPLLTLAKDKDNSDSSNGSNRHVKKRLTSLVMRWIKMKDTERRLMKELNF